MTTLNLFKNTKLYEYPNCFCSRLRFGRDSAGIGSATAFGDFEDADFSGYTVAGTTGVALNNFAISGSDYFIRTANTSAAGFSQPVSGFSGSFIAFEDVSPSAFQTDLSNAFVVDEGYLTLDPLVGGYTDLQIGFTIAAPSSSSGRYESDDLIELQYKVDGGSWVTATESTFAGGSGGLGIFNGPTTVTQSATDVLVDLPGVTSTTEFQVRVHFASGVQEEMALDDVLINGTAVPEPSAILLAGLGGVLFLGRRRQR